MVFLFLIFFVFVSASNARASNRRLGLRVGDEERRLMHLVPAPAVRLMKRRVQSRPGVRQENRLHLQRTWILLDATPSSRPSHAWSNRNQPNLTIGQPCVDWLRFGLGTSFDESSLWRSFLFLRDFIFINHLLQPLVGRKFHLAKRRVQSYLAQA